MIITWAKGESELQYKAYSRDRIGWVQYARFYLCMECFCPFGHAFGKAGTSLQWYIWEALGALFQCFTKVFVHYVSHRRSVILPAGKISVAVSNGSKLDPESEDDSSKLSDLLSVDVCFRLSSTLITTTGKRLMTYCTRVALPILFIWRWGTVCQVSTASCWYWLCGLHHNCVWYKHFYPSPHVDGSALRSDSFIRSVLDKRRNRWNYTVSVEQISANYATNIATSISGSGISRDVLVTFRQWYPSVVCRVGPVQQRNKGCAILHSVGSRRLIAGCHSLLLQQGLKCPWRGLFPSCKQSAWPSLLPFVCNSRRGSRPVALIQP